MMKTIQGYTYKVTQHIGKGYSSTVHKGINERTGECVSIKVIEMSKLQDPINQMLLQHQVTALKRLMYSQHVLHLYDVYATKNNTYLITELCDGDLAQTLKMNKQLPYYEAVDVLQQLIHGYSDINEAGYLHRDIKPANIFHKAGKFKIGDFGFAIPINEISQHKTYNVGSPVYMPPQALKQNLYSLSCDIWALGIIFFQLLKGSVPWRAISQQRLYEKMISQPIDELTQGLPEVTRTFLGQVLAMDPQNRLSLNQLKGWPGKLGSVDIRSPSPCRSTCNFQPLQQIKNFNIKMRTDRVVPIQVPQFCLSPNKVRQCQVKQNMPKQYSLKDIARGQQHFQLRDAQFFAVNSLNYLKFVNRIIKFTAEPTKVPLPNLENALVNYLLKQTNVVINYTIKTGEIQPVIKWNQFLSSKKGQNFQKKINLYHVKYIMFHATPDYQLQLNQEIIATGIRQLMDYLSLQGNYSTKQVIAADYLTTLYQLIELKSKYNAREFLHISKIDLISQGNPYQASLQHLKHLRHKLLLLKI